MTSQSVESVDLLEIYHARGVTRAIEAQIRRLRRQLEDTPPVNAVEQREILRYYQSMWFAVDQLLRMLGDESRF